MSRTSRTRRGNAAVVGITIFPLLGFASLSVDIGMQRTTIVQVQAAAEAAATGGAAYLNGSSAGITDATVKAVGIGNMNYVYGADFAITAEDVVVGIFAEGVFTPYNAENHSIADVNSVQVFPSTSNSSMLAGGLFGMSSLSAAGAATALAPRGGVAKYVDCYLPFAIPACHFLDLEDGGNPEPMMLNLQNLNTVGWGLPETNPNTNVIKQQLSDGCANGTASTDDAMELSNGQNNSAVAHFSDLVNSNDPITAAWPDGYFAEPYRGDFDGDGKMSSIIQDPPGGDQALCSERAKDNGTCTAGPPSDIDPDEEGYFGRNINGVVPIVDHPCGAGFTGDADIVGWTYAYIYDAATGGGGPKAGKFVWMQFDFVNDYDIGYGQCEGDCYGNVTGTFPPTQVFFE